jgi:transposase-like protein
MSSSKTGVSIAEMQRELEIKDYKTMWVMAHKIRKAMADRDERYNLDGLIEIDESFFGSKGIGKRGRGSESKLLVIVAISTWINDDGEEQPGFARAYVVKDASSDTIEDILKRIGTNEKDKEFFIKKIKSDGWTSYNSASRNLGIQHQRFILKNPKDAMNYLPWVHKFISNAKSVFRGPHHGISEKHLQSYLSEVCYRFNRRWWQRQLFHRLLTACLNTTTITRKELMK